MKQLKETPVWMWLIAGLIGLGIYADDFRAHKELATWITRNDLELAAPAVEGITLGIAAIRKCQEIVELIGRHNMLACDRLPANVHHGGHPEHDRAPRPVARPRVEPHRATPFGQLINAIEARSSLCE